MKHNLLKSVILSVILLMGVSNTWGQTSSTFYLAIESAKIVNNGNCSGAQFNVKYGRQDEEWKGWTTMEKTDKTYNGKVLYETTYSFPYNGYYNWQFRIEESGNQHWYTEVYAGDWNTNLHNNQIYDYENAKWVDYTCDAEYMVYFVDKSNWGAVKAYAWNGNCDNNTDYPGVDMTKTNKTYQGYNIYSFTFNKRFANILFNGGDNSKQTSDLSCYAEAGKIYDQTNRKWIDYTYDVTITFQGNGGTLNTKEATILYMAKQLNQEIVPPTRKGYTFDGWGNSGGNIKAIDAQGNVLPNAQDGSSINYTDSQGRWIDDNGCILYAQWLANQYLITFNENGGTFTANGKTKVYATYDEIVPNIGNGPDDIPWRRGYAFNGYNDKADGKGKQYYNENGIGQIKFRQTKETTVYAQWALEIYSITYELNGGTNHANNPNTYTYEYATITLQEPTKTGYTFNGWYDNSSFTETPITQISKGSYGNKTLYAKWTVNTYTVTLDQQSGTGGTASVTATYGAAMPAITKPTRNGYTFGCYYTAINGGGTQYYNANGASSKNWDKTATTTLYAKWTANQSTITWNANGGSVTPASSTYTYDGDPVALPTPTRTGYEFNGWFTASTGGTRISDVGKTNKPTSNTTYYAQWKAKTYIVTLDPQGGFSGSNSINATYDATLPAITPPTRDGYMFNGY